MEQFLVTLKYYTDIWVRTKPYQLLILIGIGAFVVSKIVQKFLTLATSTVGLVGALFAAYSILQGRNLSLLLFVCVILYFAF